MTRRSTPFAIGLVLVGLGVGAAGQGVDLSRNRVGMRFSKIPAGSFRMGSTIRPAEQPVHTVRVASFWMGITEVTQAQWQAVMGNNPSHFKEAGDNAPVEMVSWDDAQEFVQKLNSLERDRCHRLPSEAEWEYACRAGGTEETYGPVDAIAWIAENSGGTTHAVGLKRPNAFGLYDMLGNVPEWCQDTWHPDFKGAPTDGSAWQGTGSRYHPLRGGGWDLPAFFVRAALRDPYDPIHRLGFRVVCVPAGRKAARRSIGMWNEERSGLAGQGRLDRLDQLGVCERLLQQGSTPVADLGLEYVMVGKAGDEQDRHVREVGSNLSLVELRSAHSGQDHVADQQLDPAAMVAEEGRGVQRGPSGEDLETF
jgi:formylglycine-generating enzyme required for sulfatase activity